MSVFRALLCVLVVAAPAAAVDVVVLPVAGLQPPAVRGAVTTALRAEVAARGVEVLSATETDRVLADAAAFGNSCTVTISTCAIQMGSLAGGRRVVVGALDGPSLTLRAYDVASEQEVGRVVVPIDVGAPAAAARLATIRLLRPEEELGTLALTTDVLGAVVDVDGEQLGTTPTAPLPLRPGRHTVTVRPLEFELASQSAVVDIAMGAVTSLELRFRPEAPSRSRDRTPSTSSSLPVYVLDVEAPADLALPAALVTVGLVDELRSRLGDETPVGTPQDFARLHAGAFDQIADCAADPGCLRTRLQGRVAAVLVATSLERVGEQLSLRSVLVSFDGAPTREARAVAPAQRGGAALASRVGFVVADLYPQLNVAVLPADALEARYAPPALPVWAWGATVAGLGAGLVVAGGSLAGYVGAAPDDPARTGWTIGVVVGAVVAAAGLAGSIVEIPFVDWYGLQAENAQLLEERAARGYSSR